MRAGLRVGTVLTGIVLVLAVASAAFAVQYAQAYAQCSAVPRSAPCADVSSARIAVDGLFVALAGGLTAIVMAITSGINWRQSPPPNTALARRLEEEAEAFKLHKQRRAELAELNGLALEQVRAAAEAQAEATAASAIISKDGAATAGSIVTAANDPHWQLEEDTAPVESRDQAQSRILADRLKTLARNKPEAVADVIRTWIDQSGR